MKRYRKKPIEIEAVQWTGSNLEEIKSFVGESLQYDIVDVAWKVGKGVPCVHVVIKTLEGDHVCSEGDYIIKGIKGELYPCKPDIFAATYEDPSADVAPKSEVDNWYRLYHSIKDELKQEKMYHRETENLCDRYCIESQQAKKQAAREIFEAIEREVASKIPMKFTPIFKRDLDYDAGVIDGKHDAFFEVLVLIAELKKKYTEGAE